MVADGVDTHRAANLLSCKQGFGEGVVVEVVDRCVVSAAGAVASNPGGGYAHGFEFGDVHIVDGCGRLGAAAGIVSPYKYKFVDVGCSDRDSVRYRLPAAAQV